MCRLSFFFLGPFLSWHLPPTRFVKERSWYRDHPGSSRNPLRGPLREFAFPNIMDQYQNGAPHLYGPITWRCHGHGENGSTCRMRTPASGFKRVSSPSNTPYFPLASPSTMGSERPAPKGFHAGGDAMPTAVQLNSSNSCLKILKSMMFRTRSPVISSNIH